MDETVQEDVVTVGQRLREAREAKGLSIEEIAASTRIPTRHLASLESSEWDKLPAPTYSIGFAKNYAGAVGLDRHEIGEALRVEMGGSRPMMASPEVYEAADPARTMPKGLIFGAIAVLALVVAGLMWMRSQALRADPVEEAEANTLSVNAVAPAPAPATAGPVVITATEAVWVDIRDGQAILKQGELKVGERFDVPTNAVAPTLTTGKPEALQIMVGQSTAAPVGEAGKRVSDVSLKGEDLLKTAAAAAPAATPPVASPQPSAARPQQRSSPRPVASPPPVTAAPAPATASEPATVEPATPTE